MQDHHSNDLLYQLHFDETMIIMMVMMMSMLYIFFRFLCCPIRCLDILSPVLWYALPFPMLGSSLPPVVLFTLFVFGCLIVMPNAYCVVFLFCLSSWVLCTQCCQFLWIVHFRIAPSVFSNVYCTRPTPFVWLL